MKKMLSLFMAVISLSVVIAQPPKGPAKAGMVFGANTTVDGAVDINNLSAKIKEGGQANVKIKGRVTEVCTEMGCWLKMSSDNGDIMVKMKDHAFFVPVELNGKEIVVDGTAKVTITPVEELKHYAEDAGNSKEEIAMIKAPKKEIVVTAKGVLVL